MAFDFMATLDEPVASLFRLAFAATMVGYSNYSYEPSLGRKASVGRPEVVDDDVAGAIAAKLRQMADDAAWYRGARENPEREDGRVFERSFFDGYSAIPAESVDLLVTSPPYLNNYHYNRNTRPHLYWLGFCAAPREMKRLEELNFGTYWQNARDEARIDLDLSIDDSAIREAIDTVRQRNPDKGVYGGNGWANYAAQYFNDCARFLDGAAWCLRPGATALVVIGNSILQGVPIPTDRFLAAIAETARRSRWQTSTFPAKPGSAAASSSPASAPARRREGRSTNRSWNCGVSKANSSRRLGRPRSDVLGLLAPSARGARAT